MADGMHILKSSLGKNWFNFNQIPVITKWQNISD